eukprot:TRINITY_DN64107_c0_g1_i1.p1 TRINITY_DN64107_c0_g1~~TRINITY_DN64107_c0_g1_i1.p1  ORF type:complete len:266 (-),score=32.19 TRINITY_DN64107_c0_g1_i1:63-860(-)
MTGRCSVGSHRGLRELVAAASCMLPSALAAPVASVPMLSIWRHLAARLSPSPYAVVALGCWIVVCIIIVWRWLSYLGAKPEPSRGRAGLKVALLLATTAELILCCTGHLHWWMIFVIVFVNGWGPLDAVLRYPHVHDVDTLFTVKQMLLLCIKLGSLAFGLSDLLAQLALLVGLGILNFVLMPAIYVTALPLDARPQEYQKLCKGVPNIDVAVKMSRYLGKMASDPQKRRDVMRKIERQAEEARATFAPHKCSRLPLFRGNASGC